MPLIVLLAGAALDIGIVLLARRVAHEHRQDLFALRAQRWFDAAATTMGDNLQTLRAVGGLVHAVDTVDGEEFRGFVRRCLENSACAFRAVEWIPAVTTVQRAAVECGLPGGHISEKAPDGSLVPAHERDCYYPVALVEPLVGNERAVGYDLGSDALRLAALLAARDAGEAHASAPITLVQDPGGRPGVLLFLPVYGGAPSPATADERRARLRGFVLGVLVPQGIVERAGRIAGRQGIGITVSDVTVGSAEKILAGDGPAEEEAVAGQRFHRQLTVGGRTWRVGIGMLPAADDDSVATLLWLLAAALAILTVVVSATLWWRGATQARLEALIDSLADANGRLVAGERQLGLFRTIIEQNPIAIAITDREQTITYANSAFVAQTGCDLAASLGREVLPTEIEGEVCTRSIARTGDEAAGLRIGEYCDRHRDGREYWLERIVVPLRGENDALIGFVHFRRDITVRRAALAQLRESEERYRSLVDRLPEAVIIAVAGTIRFVNPAAATLLGSATPLALIGREMADLIDAEGRAIFVDRCRRLEAGCMVPRFELRCLRLDGKAVEVEMAALQASYQQQPGTLIIARDITARKHSQALLLSAHTEAELLLSSISAALIGIDRDGLVTRWNKAAEAIFGCKAKRAIGARLEDCGIRWDWEEVAKARGRSRETGARSELHEVRFEQPDGKSGWLSVAVDASWGMDGGVGAKTEQVILAVDITERRMREALQNQSAKLESIGQLAAGIAHEINTPIQFIGDNLRFLADANRDLGRVLEARAQLIAAVGAQAPAELAEAAATAEREADVGYLQTEMPKAIAQSLEGVQRVGDIVKAMKAFSHPDDGSKEPGDLNQALTTTLTVARNEYKYVAEVVTDFDPDLPKVPCFFGQMNQVFLNLLVNAAHAIADAVKDSGRKGRITLATRRAGEFAEVRIADTGTGIPERVRDRIFEPFFTTKGVGRGTGQGLYLAHNVVVKTHGGTIGFETESGVGTTFIIRLPIHPAVADGGT